MRDNDLILRMRWEGQTDPVDLRCAPAAAPYTRSAPPAPAAPSPVVAHEVAAPTINVARRGAFWRGLRGNFRLHRATFFAATVVALVCCVFSALSVQMGMQASAVLIGSSNNRDALQAEIAILHSANISQAIVDRVGAATLLECNLLTTPRALLQTNCFSGNNNHDPSQAMAVAREARAVTMDESGKFLRLSVVSASPRVAAAVLDAAIARESQERHQIVLERGITAIPPEQDTARQELARIDQSISELRSAKHIYNPAQSLASSMAEEAGLSARESDLRQRLSATQSEIATAQELLRNTQPRIVETQETLRRDSSENARQTLMQLRLERAHLQATYAPGYDGLAELDHKIQIAEDSMRAPSTTQETTARDQRNPVFENLTATVARLMPEAEGMAAQLREMGQQHARLAERTADLRSITTQLEDLLSHRERQAAVVRELASTSARTQSESAMSSAALADMRWIVETPSAMWPSLSRLVGGVLGGCLGFAATIALQAARGNFRRTYETPTDAERHLKLPRLAHIHLGPTQRETPLPPALVEYILRGHVLPPAGVAAPMLAIHLIGTSSRDGTAEVAQRLAQSISSQMARGVLLIEIGKTGREWIESIAPTGLAAVPEPDASDSKMLEPGSRALSTLARPALRPVACAADLVSALLDAPYRFDTAMAVQLSRLRAEHQLLVVVSTADEQHQPHHLAAAPDLTLVVLHAQNSDKLGMSELCAKLSARREVPAGFVFTEDTLVDCSA